MKNEKNECSKTRKKSEPYEIWKGFAGLIGWEWHVLKKYQVDDLAPGAKYKCLVKNKANPDGVIQDVDVWEIKKYGMLQNRKRSIVIDLADIDIMIPPFPF